MKYISKLRNICRNQQKQKNYCSNVIEFHSALAGIPADISLSMPQ